MDRAAHLAAGLAICVLFMAAGASAQPAPAPTQPAPQPVPAQPAAVAPAPAAAAPAAAPADPNAAVPAAPPADAWSTVISKGQQQERENETDAQRELRQDRADRNEAERERDAIASLRSRTRVFVSAGLGYEYSDLSSDEYYDDFANASPQNPNVDIYADTVGIQFGVGAGVRIGLAPEWQLNLPVQIAYLSSTESDGGSMYNGTNSAEFEATANRWSFSFSPTIRYHFAGPWYAGIGGYVAAAALSLSCESMAEQYCSVSDFPESEFLGGGLGEVGVLLGPEEEGNAMLIGYGGGNSTGGDGDGGVLLAFSWALL